MDIYPDASMVVPKLATYIINCISEPHNDLDDLPTHNRKMSPWQIHEAEIVF